MTKSLNLDNKFQELLSIIFEILNKNDILKNHYKKKFYRSFSINIGIFYEKNENANKIINLLRNCYDPRNKIAANLIIDIIRLIINEPKRHTELSRFSTGYQNIFSVQPEPPDAMLNILGYLSCLGSILTGSINMPKNYLKSAFFFNKEKQEKLIQKLKDLIFELQEFEKEWEKSNRFKDNIKNDILNNDNLSIFF